MLNKIIFAIDNDCDLHTVAKFLRHIDTERVMGNIKGSFIKCIGCYEGTLENSYIMDERDYREFVEAMGYTDNQESILHVPADTRQPCTLEFKDKTSVTLGQMRELNKSEVIREGVFGSWTYVPRTDTYWGTD